MEIAYDDLEYRLDGDFLFRGVLFTGTTIDRDQEGRKVSEASFLNGREHGIARSWYPNFKARHRMKTESYTEFDVSCSRMVQSTPRKWLSLEL
jgi:hypothetical protein